VLFAQLSPGTALTAASFVRSRPCPTCRGRELRPAPAAG
jgi:hypothetical protein